MSILIFAIVVLIVAALLVYLCDVIPLPHPFSVIVKVLIVLVAALAIAQRAGWL